MRYILLIILSLNFVGCSEKKVGDAITSLQIAMSGNKPPSFFKIANLQTMKDYMFDVRDTTFSLPSAKEEDFTKMGGWEGSTHYNKDVYLYLDNDLGVSYHIGITSSINAYTERERAIEQGDITYLRSRMPYKTLKNGEIYNITLKTVSIGKENYPCIVRESAYPKYGKLTQSYGCFKSNSNKTIVKSTSITLTYNKIPNLSKEIADEYTYEDLQNRAKRILDSLYIKDGWEK